MITIIVCLISFISITESIQRVKCDYFSEWEKDWMGSDIAEAGQICLFNLTSPHQRWKLNHDFSCGESKTRVVMCQKAFEQFQYVSLCIIMIICMQFLALLILL